MNPVYWSRSCTFLIQYAATFVECSEKADTGLYLYPLSAPASIVWEFINLIESRSAFCPQPVKEIQIWTGREPTLYLHKQPSKSHPHQWLKAVELDCSFYESSLFFRSCKTHTPVSWISFATGGIWAASAAMLSQSTCQGVSPPAMGRIGANS